jgi:hypothetical protein
MTNKLDEEKNRHWFMTKFWAINPKGTDPNLAYMSYSRVLYNEVNTITNQKYKQEDLLKLYKAYKAFKISEKGEFVKGGHEPLLSITDYFNQNIYKQNFKIEKEPNPDRDTYLFGENLI